jgi:hypothetical protein
MTIIRVAFGALLTAAFVMTGCGGYTIQGQIVRGSYGDASFVNADDSAINAAPVPSAAIRIIRDPDKLSSEVVGSATSKPDGSFELVVDSFGAGFLDERFAVRAVRNGYDDVEVVLRLPGSPSGRILLIQMVSGASGGLRDERQRLLDEYEQFR